MAVSIPGLSLSILRQQTSVRAGLPLLISGRFTAFGLGVPVFIRVLLEGPSYDPQIRSFDTFASPFSGDYTVNVIAEKDGRYSVYAQAFPPPLIPTGPPFPDPILLLPPMAESTRPPLVVGFPFNGGVDALMPDGTSQRLEAPAMQPIEFRPLITVGAPGVYVTLPGVGAVPVPTIPWFPEVPGAPPAPPVAPPVEAIARAAIDDILFIPPEINPGMEATGVMAWRNTGDAPQLFDIVFYLVSPVGVSYGPLQVNLEVSAHPQVPTTQNLRLSTEGLPSGFYSVVGEIYDITTGALVADRTLPNRLSIREIAPPVVPVPPPPVVPVPVAPDILGTPQLNLPNQITVGDVWAGSVSLPTFGDVPFFGEASLVIVAPTGVEQIVAQGGRTIQPGEILQVPVNFDTTGFAAGNYPILLRVFDQMGSPIAEFPMGFLSMLAAALPPIPEVPVLPTAPTADMFRTPSVNLPTQLEIGEIWQGGITIPTMAPPALMQLPSLPSFPVNIGLQLQNPAGQLFDVGAFQPTFTPGQPINLPVNFDTSVLPQEGIHNLVMNIQDLQGNQLFSNVIGALQALMPAVPPIPLVPPELSEFPSIAVNLGTSQAEMDGTLSIPITYTHVGAPETVILYAAIGNDRPPYLGGFDEVWHAQKTISVDPDPIPKTRQETINIPITPKLLAAGVYSVYAKIMGRGLPFRDVISPTLQNIVEVLAPPELPVPPPLPPPPVISRADIKDIDFRILTAGPFNPGDTISWIMPGVYKGRAQRGSLTISLGLGSFAPLISLIPLPIIPVNFEQSTDWAPFSFTGSFSVPANVRPGYTYSVKARLEALEEPTQETDHDFNIITIVAAPPAPPPPAPVLPRADIADFNFQIVPAGTSLDPGDTGEWRATGKYRGRAQDGRLTISLGTGPVGTFFTRFTLPTNPVNFNESYDWREVSFSGFFTIPPDVEPGQTYSTRARLEAILEPAQETDTDWGVITIVAAVPVGPSEFLNVSVAYPTAPVRIGGSVSLQVSFRHFGQGESEWLYAAIGNDGVFGFDEILNNRKAITVPDEAQPIFHSEIINIPVTSAIKPGTYDVYAKIGLGVPPRAISATTHDVIRITD